MADDEEDARGPVTPEELFAPTGPRRSNFTPAPTDADALEAAANVFNDDAIAAALAAELARVASGPIPIQRPAAPAAEAATAPPVEPVAPTPPAVPIPPAASVPQPIEPAPIPQEPAPVVAEPQSAFAPPPAPVAESAPVAAPAPAAEPAPLPEPAAAAPMVSPEPISDTQPEPSVPVASNEPPSWPSVPSNPPAGAPMPPQASAPPEWASPLFGQPTVQPASTQPTTPVDPYAPGSDPFAPPGPSFLPPPENAPADLGAASAPAEIVPPAFAPSPVPTVPPTNAAEDERRLLQGAAPPSVPPADAPPPPGYVPAATTSTPATPQPPAEDPYAGGSNTLSAIEELQAQLEQRSRNAAEGVAQPPFQPPSVDGTPVPPAAARPAAPVFPFSVPSAPTSPGVFVIDEPDDYPPVPTDPPIDLAPPEDVPAAPTDEPIQLAPPVDEPIQLAPPTDEPTNDLSAPSDEPISPAPPADEPISTLAPPSDDPFTTLAPPADEPFAIPAPTDEPTVDAPEPASEPFSGMAPPSDAPFSSLAPPEPDPVSEPAPPAAEPFATLAPPTDAPFATVAPPVDEVQSIPAPPVDEPIAQLPPPADEPADQLAPPVDELPFELPPPVDNDTPVFLAPPTEAAPTAPSALPDYASAPPPQLFEPAKPFSFDEPPAGAAPAAFPFASAPVPAPAAPVQSAPDAFSQPPLAGSAPVAESAPTAEPAPPSATPPDLAVFDGLLAGNGEPNPRQPSTVFMAAAPPPEPEPDTPGEGESEDHLPFGSGVERDDAVDPSDSIFGSGLGPVSVNTAGVAVITGAISLESRPILISRPEPQPEPEPIGPRIFDIEAAGLEPTPVQQRIGRATRLFWLWFAVNSSIAGIVFGALILGLGIDLRQAVIAIFAGIVLSFIPLGLGTLAGKRSGQPTMVVSRATFGLVGNILPSVVALLSRMFWAAALLWILGAGSSEILVGANLTDGFNGQQLTLVILAAALVVAAVISYFGYAFMAAVQLAVSFISGVALVGFIALTSQYVSLRTALSVGDGPWILVVTGAVLVFSFVGLAWANSSSDLARYQRPGSSGAASMLLATIGTALPSFLLIAYGALLAASNSKLAASILTDPMDALGRLLPAWYPAPLLAATALSLLTGVIVSLYSGGFALQAVGLRVRRSVSTLLVGILALVIAVAVTLSVTDFTGLMRDFATTIAVPVAAWAGIFAAETMIRNRRYHSDSLLRRGGIYPDVNWINLVAFVVLSVIGFGLTSATVPWLSWEGYLWVAAGVPLHGDLAASDLGVLVALILGLAVPGALGIRAIRRQEGSAPPAE